MINYGYLIILIETFIISKYVFLPTQNISNLPLCLQFIYTFEPYNMTLGQNNFPALSLLLFFPSQMLRPYSERFVDTS